MKIKYEFINGESTEIEVEEGIGTWILDSRRVEENLARKERYHCYSSDVAWEGLDYADFDTPESTYIQKCNENDFAEVYETLTEVQKRRLELLLDGLSLREIARREGVEIKSVRETMEQIRKKYKKFI